MCWSVPSKIVLIEDEKTALVELSGVKSKVGLDLIDDAKVGDYVLVHAGYALQKVNEEKAKFTLDFFKNRGQRTDNREQEN